MKKKLFIEGMSCGHCVKHVSDALNELTGVNKVEVDLAGKYAVLDAVQEISDEDIRVAIDDAGYEVVKIEELS